MKDILVTCPSMLGQFDLFVGYTAERGLKLHRANVTQILSEDELCETLPDYDGWIIGDDPATRRVFETAQKGRLSAAVKWGIGVDVATAFVIGLARQLFEIDRGVRAGAGPNWQASAWLTSGWASLEWATSASIPLPGCAL